MDAPEGPAIPSGSRQIISGQKGCKLTIEATVNEIAETAWLKSQGKKMIQRWLEIKRVAHQMLAGAKPWTALSVRSQGSRAQVANALGVAERFPPMSMYRVR